MRRTAREPKGRGLLASPFFFSGRREIATFAALHAALAFALFAPALVTGGLIVPGELLHAIYPWGAYFPRHVSHNRELTDVILQFYPWFLHWAEAVRAGHFPLWNPWSGLGLPFAANPQTASFFPLTALSLLGDIGWNLLLVARFFIAGLSATLWLRETGRSRGAAGAGGIAFALSFPFFGWLQWPHANVNALLPLLLLLARRLALRPTRRSAAGFGLTMAFMHLGGHPESVFLDAAAALVVFFAARPRRRGALLLGAAGCLGTLAASVQILPFLAYLGRSRVWLESGHESIVLPRRFLAGWLVPLLFGRSVERTTWASPMPFLDTGAYAGAAILALAVVFLLLRPRARRVIAPLLLVVLPVGLAYGIPPISWLLRLPLLGRVMTHRSLHIAALGLVMLGAAGWDRLRAARRLRPELARRSVLAPAALALGAVALVLAFRPGAPPSLFARAALPGGLQAVLASGAAWGAAMLVPTRRRLMAGAVLCALVLLDEGRIAVPFHGEVHAPRGVFFRTHLTDALSGEARGFRVLPLRIVLPPNLNLPYRFASVLSYDAVDSVAQARFLRRLRAYAGRGLFSSVNPEGLRNPDVARLAGVRDLVDDPTAPPLDTAAFARATGFALVRIYDQPDGRIYRIDGALPAVSFAARADRDPGLKRFYELLDAGDPSAARRIFVDSEEAPAFPEGPGSLEYARPFAERIEARVNAPAGGWLVVAEALDDGWEAHVDGSPAPLYVANDVLRAVPVAPGRHEVVLRYRPPMLLLGALLSVLGVAGLVALATARPRHDSPVTLDSPR